MSSVRSLPNALLPEGAAPLSSNQDAMHVPFQRWYNFKEAFAPQLVANIIQQLPQSPRTCLDPFGGSGTTAITCQFLGVHPTLIEVNPFLADLAESKLATYDAYALTRDRGRLAEYLAQDIECELPPDAFPDAPRTFVEPGLGGRWIFDRSVAERIWQYRCFIDGLENSENARLFRVLLGSTLIPLSNVTISGKGRRYRSNWQDRRAVPQALDDRFEASYQRALYDICRFHSRACRQYDVMRGDAREVLHDVDRVDLVITSPPYPNSFDYTDIYNVELWALGYLRARSDNRRLREATLRSHVQIKRSFAHQELPSSSLEKTLTALRGAEDRLWDKDIPAMVGAYFGDLYEVLCGLRSRLISGGCAVLIVGDSRYAGVHIDVAAVVAEVGKVAGFEMVERYPVRSMRSSPQDGGTFDLKEWLIRLVAS